MSIREGERTREEEGKRKAYVGELGEQRVKGSRELNYFPIPYLAIRVA